MSPAGRVVIALGTTRRPKVKAVERALDLLREKTPGFLPASIDVEPVQVDSGAPSTPVSTEHMMRGARTRASNARAALIERGVRPGYAIGLEGGLSREADEVFLESWAYAVSEEAGYFGSSGRIALPRPLADAVLERHEDLGPAADAYFSRRDVAGSEGTFGLLTLGVITREDAFLRAILHAMAPFYNADAYRASR